MDTLELLQLIGADANEKSDAEELNEIFQMATPVIQVIISNVADVVDQIITDGKLNKSIAKFSKQQYDSYIEAGFTEEQAFMLLLNGKEKLMDSISKLGGEKK